MKEIKFKIKNRIISIPNAWELLTPKLYEELLKDIQRMAIGEMSVAIVRANYICNVMEWNPAKIDVDGYNNLAWLAEQVDFIFNISYPDPEVLNTIAPETKKLLKKTPPEKITNSAIARYLSTLDYTYVLDSCFCAQLLPVVKIDRKIYQGYKIDTSFSTLTCSLTALQFIEARALLGSSTEMLPLLAAILYYPGKYDSLGAHGFAKIMSKLPEITLQGIAFNFQSFSNYLFLKTDFYILTASKPSQTKCIATGALETLYNLTADGMGDITGVEQMNVIQYLTVLRKKLIESVHTLSDSGIDVSDISEKTGLPIHIINSILK